MPMWLLVRLLQDKWLAASFPENAGRALLADDAFSVYQNHFEMTFEDIWEDVNECMDDFGEEFADMIFEVLKEHSPYLP